MTSTLPAAPLAASPAATRLPRRRWKDWRLLAGVAVLLASTAVGARVVAGADDTTPTWAAARTLVPGTALTAADLVRVPVRVEGENPYLTGAVPAGYVVTREVAAGELVPGAAVVPAGERVTPTRLVAVAVDPATLPGRLAPGDRVDVWAAPDDLNAGDRPADLVVAAVRVVETPSVDVGFAGSGRQPVVLVVEAGTDGDLDSLVADLVAASSAGRVVLTLAPGTR